MTSISFNISSFNTYKIIFCFTVLTLLLIIIISTTIFYQIDQVHLELEKLNDSFKTLNFYKDEVLNLCKS